MAEVQEVTVLVAVTIQGEAIIVVAMVTIGAVTATGLRVSVDPIRTTGLPTLLTDPIEAIGQNTHQGTQTGIREREETVVAIPVTPVVVVTDRTTTSPGINRKKIKTKAWGFSCLFSFKRKWLTPFKFLSVS